MTNKALQIAEPRRTFIPFRPAEKKAFTKRRKLPGPEWAERNIYVPIGSRQGLYRNANNPPLYGIMKMAGLPHVRVIVMAKGIQTGGTLGFYILLLREADYSSGGDNALIVMADEASVKKLSKGRLRKMIDKSPSLAALKSVNPDDTAVKSIALADGFTIDAAWISSETSVSSESYRVLIIDEISKKAYRKNRGNIADAKGRTTVYPDTKKEFIFSSPGLDSDDPNDRDPLMIEAESCDVTCDFYVKCPDCGLEQVMIFERFKWPEQKGLLPGSTYADPKEIRRHRSAWYQCQCGSRWNDYKRDKAVLAAMKDGWKASDPTVEYPQSIYVHYPSWLSPFMSLSEVVARWLEAQGDDDLLQKWYNLIAGISYKPTKQERQEDQILKLVDPSMPSEVVPEDTSCLMLLVDTQQVGFYYEVVAFGWGKDLESWQVEYSFIETFAQVKELSERRWNDASGKEYAISIAYIDSGGGTNPLRPNHSRTKEVYEFCIDNPLFRPLKGRRSQATPWSISRQSFFPSRDGKKVPIPGGLNLYIIDVTIYKNQLAGKLQIAPGHPGGMHLNASADSEYARQMCAEYRDESGYWECPKHKPNHYWDLAVYRFAAADIARLRTREKKDSAPRVEVITPAKPSHQPAALPSWFRNR